jgi:hypothetical protein
MGNAHCGRCVPCIIRQSSFVSAGVNDPTTYRTNIKDGLMEIDGAKGADIQAFKYMIAKVTKHPDYLRASIRMTGPLPGDVGRFIDVYSRALREVEFFLNDTQLARRADIRL